MIVLGIETSTPCTSVAIGSETGTVASLAIAARRGRHDLAVAAIDRLLKWNDLTPERLGGVVVGTGPGLFTGLRVGIEIGKTLAQVLRIPIVGVASLDALAFAVRFTRRPVAAMIDARRGEVFYGLYRPVPGGITRQSEFLTLSPDSAAAEIEALGEDILLTGDGATLYRRRFEELGSRVEFAPTAIAHPDAASLVELAIPRIQREEFDRVADVVPTYLRKSDAEIAWDQRTAAAES